MPLVVVDGVTATTQVVESLLLLSVAGLMTTLALVLKNRPATGLTR
jgi:hypothetical protein